MGLALAFTWDRRRLWVPEEEHSAKMCDKGLQRIPAHTEQVRAACTQALRHEVFEFLFV